MGVSSSIQPAWPSWQWPRVFGTSPVLSPGMFRIFRGLMAAVFVGHQIWHAWDAIVLREHGWYYLIFLTTWSLFLETLNMVLMFILALMASEAPEPNEDAEFQKESEPLLARVSMVIFSISQPVSMGVAVLYWTLLTPIWDVWAGVEPVPSYLSMFAHGIDWILMFMTFFACRVPFTCSHVGWTTLFAVLYAAWSYLHHVLRIGKSWTCEGYDDPADCPIYDVLDWNDPQKAGTITGAAVVGVGLLIPCVYVLLAWLRDRCDSRADLQQIDEERQREKLLLQSDDEINVTSSRRNACACLTCV
ncbi:Scn10a [Symbiodinium natans]|uniref:Scn10a protein n=1 Tax=Symbiodinium natans TaxID=878477 RepID=A0A812KVD4_9DINO|nr:Scn10a [Symbiodinium natans]